MRATGAVRVLAVAEGRVWNEVFARLAAHPGVAALAVRPSAEGLWREVRRTRPGVLILDLAVPGVDPLAALGRLVCVGHPLRAVVVAGGPGDPAAAAAAVAGAWGVLGRADIEAECVEAVLAVARGEFFTGEAFRGSSPFAEAAGVYAGA